MGQQLVANATQTMNGVHRASKTVMHAMVPQLLVPMIAGWCMRRLLAWQQILQRFHLCCSYQVLWPSLIDICDFTLSYFKATSFNWAMSLCLLLLPVQHWLGVVEPS